MAKQIYVLKHGYHRSANQAGGQCFSVKFDIQKEAIKRTTEIAKSLG